MGRPRKKPLYVIVGSELAYIGKERILDLRIQVTHGGKRQSLLRLLSPDPADALIRTAREVVTLTFSEMYSEDQHEAVLHQIRNNIWDVLPAFNEYLTAIEVEPIAAKVEADQPPSP